MVIPSTSAWFCGSVELFVLGTEHVTDRYVGWLNDPDLNRYLESRFETHTLESTRAYVVACASNERTLFLGIRCLSSVARHVGNIKLEINPRHGLGEVGILIGEKDAHGRGVATRAIQMLAQIARDELRLRKLTAGCYAGNKASQRAFEKAGFVVEGHRVAHFLYRGKPEDLTLMGLIL